MNKPNISTPRVLPLLAALICLFQLPALESHAEIFKCIDEQGSSQFSDKPCAPNAEKIELQVPESSGIGLGGTGDYSEIAGANKKRDVDRRYQAAQRKLDSLRKDYDEKVEELDKRSNSLPNNPRAKRARLEISQKRKRLRERYREDKKRANVTLSRVRSEARSLR